MKATAKAGASDNVILTKEVREAIENGGAVFLKVPTKDLKYKSNTGKSDVGFQNPRQKKGFETDSIQDLAEAIKNHGLIKNLLVRQVDDLKSSSGRAYEIVAGERRARAIQSLIDQDCLVKDLATGLKNKASQVYAKIPCLIQGKCDDKTATVLAFMENDTHVPLSDADVIDMCVVLEAQGMDRKEQGKLINKSQAWLSHTFNFANKLTPDNYARLRSGEICRSVAVKLMDYDEEVQTPVIEAAKEIATERHKAVKKKTEEELDQANDVLTQVYNEQLEVINRRNADERSKRQAENKTDRAEKTVNKLLERRRQLVKTVPVPSQSDVAEGAFRAGLDPHGNRNLTSSQIREHFTDKCSHLLNVDEGNPLDLETGFRFFRRDVELIKMIT